MPSLVVDKQISNRIVRQLKKAYPEAGCSLRFRTPLELVIATMLSAQSTDVRVNLTTPALFERYKRVDDFARARLSELQRLIKPIGLYRNKARNIIALAKELQARFDSKVPETQKELESLPGIGRKSANVIRGELTGEGEGIAVDTHVARLAYRLGLSKYRDPKKIEADLMKWISHCDWVIVAHLLIQHGRTVCQARRPQCERCFLKSLCPQNGL